MSSITLDASGPRGIGMTVNDPQRTAASISTKGDDDISIHAGNLKEFNLWLPLSSVVKHLKKGDNEHFVLKLGFINITGYQDLEGTNLWPHATVRVQKGMQNDWVGDEVEVVREVVIGELLGLEDRL